jgi:hypothetical protein
MTLNAQKKKDKSRTLYMIFIYDTDNKRLIHKYTYVTEYIYMYENKKMLRMKQKKKK